MEKVKCNKCGNEIPQESEFCPYCGSRIQSSAGSHQSDSKGLKIGLCILSVICIALGGLVVYEIQQVNAAKEQVEEKERTIDYLRYEISQKENVNDNYYQQISELKTKISKMSPAYNFYSNYACIVPSNNNVLKYYHTYDCSDCDKSSFRIFNTEAAKVAGYYPCPKCH